MDLLCFLNFFEQIIWASLSVYNWNRRGYRKNIMFYSFGLCYVLRWLFLCVEKKCT